jgi:hypothetical protein
MFNKLISNLIEKKITISFNWITVIFHLFFISYGIYSARTFGESTWLGAMLSTLPFSIFLVAIIVFFGILASKKREEFKDSIAIRNLDWVLFSIVFLILLFFTKYYISYSLFSDELFYSFEAHKYAFSLTINKIVYPWVSDFSIALVMQGFSLIFLICILSLILILERFNWVKKIVICSILLISFRVIISKLGGATSPHPPLNLLPILISGSFFGLSDFSLKLSSFIPYVIYVVVLQRMISRKFDEIISLLMALAIGTIPLTLLLSTVVEQSLYSSMCFSIILVDLITSDKPKYIRLISIASIATLFRQPSFFVIIPIIFIYFWQERFNIKSFLLLKNIFILLSPTLIFLPFLLLSLIYGTPSTHALNNNELLLKVLIPYQALVDGRVWISILNSVSIWWISFIPLAFLPIYWAWIRLNFSFLILFFILIFIFYSINQHLWGEAKYQAEYAVPFAVAGFIFFCIKFFKIIKSKIIFSTLLIILILLNYNELTGFHKDNKPVDQSIDTINEDKKHYKSGFKMMVTFPYSYADAYNVIKVAGLASNSYSLGVTYGVLPEILNGYTVKEVVNASQLLRHQLGLMVERGIPWTSASVELIESDPRIKVVLIACVFPGKFDMVEEFKRNGWLTLGEFRNSRFGSTVFVLKRGVFELEVQHGNTHLLQGSQK